MPKHGLQYGNVSFNDIAFIIGHMTQIREREDMMMINPVSNRVMNDPQGRLSDETA